MSEWISIEDRLPKIGQDVLVYELDYFDDDEICIARLTEELEWYRPFKNISVNYWMPLPEPPNGKKQN